MHFSNELFAGLTILGAAGIYYLYSKYSMTPRSTDDCDEQQNIEVDFQVNKI